MGIDRSDYYRDDSILLAAIQPSALVHDRRRTSVRHYGPTGQSFAPGYSAAADGRNRAGCFRLGAVFYPVVPDAFPAGYFPVGQLRITL